MSERKNEEKRKKISFDYDNSNIWDEIYLRVCFLGETVLVMIRRLSRQLQRLSLSLSVENQFQVMKKSREE